MDTPFQLDKALQGVGELLARRGDEAAIVVVGGTALNLLGVVERYTRDVDASNGNASAVSGWDCLIGWT